VLAEGRDIIDAADLPQVGSGQGWDALLEGPTIGSGITTGGYHETRTRVIARFEKEYLSRILHETEGNVSEAARLAGVNRATLYRLLERHGLTKRDVIE
jgi:transcriptional regulator of acetoin/glycerol metabolism